RRSSAATRRLPARSRGPTSPERGRNGHSELVADEMKLGVAATLPKVASRAATIDDIRGIFQRQLDPKLHPGASLAVDVRHKVVAAMEDAVAEFEPGTTAAYHSFNHGWVCAELVRRVDGRPLPKFFRDEIALPLGMSDTFIGPPVEELERVAKVHPYPDILSDHIIFAEKFNRREIITA